jgi:hypothetical protein
MAPGETTSIRLDDEDRKLLASIQKETGITSITAVFRYLLRMYVNQERAERKARKAPK